MIQRPQIVESPQNCLREFLLLHELSMEAVTSVKIRGLQEKLDPSRITSICNLTAQERLEQSVGTNPACVVTLRHTRLIVQIVTSKVFGFALRRFIRVEPFRSVSHLRTWPKDAEPGVPRDHAVIPNPRTFRLPYDLPDRGITRPVRE